MPKRIRYIDGVELYDIIRSRDNVEGAVKEACRDHHKDKLVRMIKAEPEPYIADAKKTLDEQSFHYGRFKHKTIREKGKVRKLSFTSVIDNIIHHAAMRVVAPILLGKGIHQVYSAQKGKGLHKGMKIIARRMHNDPEGHRFCYKIDLYHYFQRVHRPTLWKMIKKYIKCPRTLDLLHRFIFEPPPEDGDPEVSILIGLYTSQIFSTFYLTEFDRWVKQTLLWPEYHRYADDIVFFARSKQRLRQLRKIVEDKLRTYGMKVRHNWQIFPSEVRGVDFMGFVIRKDFVLLRKRVKVSYRRAVNVMLRLARIGEEIIPYFYRSERSYRKGMASWGDCKHLTDKHTARLNKAGITV